MLVPRPPFSLMISVLRSAACPAPVCCSSDSAPGNDSTGWIIVRSRNPVNPFASLSYWVRKESIASGGMPILCMRSVMA